jgi:hypothetical protein
MEFSNMPIDIVEFGNMKVDIVEFDNVKVDESSTNCFLVVEVWLANECPQKEESPLHK